MLLVITVYLVVLVLVLVQLEQSAKVMANSRLMQQLASPAVHVLEPALPEQFQKSKIAELAKENVKNGIAK